MTAKHTPTPWTVGCEHTIGKTNFKYTFSPIGTKPNIALMAKIDEQAGIDARHIVKCVNCHDELITACKGMLKDLEKVCSEAMYRNIDGDLVTPYTESMKKAKQALAKAQEE